MLSRKGRCVKKVGRGQEQDGIGRGSGYVVGVGVGRQAVGGGGRWMLG